jgi:phosphodiesterase/alkaline phosphatase D-like protein
MGALEPDFFLCSGDTVYADGPLAATVPLPGGRTWRNVVTPAKSKVAETLDEFRGQFAYNLLDANLRAFAARVPQVNQWDDHEVHNNWFPGQVLADDRYTERRADVLAARARQAFFEYLPIAPQVEDETGRMVLAFAHEHGIGGIVLLTADVHYTSAHHYDPARAAVADFTPFWEFVFGPLNAGAFGPNALDATFGPQVVFQAAPPAPNTSPADGFQFFGHVAIDGDTRVMTVSLRDLDGAVLFSTELDPPPG